MYEAEEVIRELNQFRYDALQRLLKLELRVDELHVEDKELKKDIHELKTALMKETDDLNTKIEFIRNEMPSSTTNKIMFAVFGATLSFLFAMILLLFR